MSLTKIPAHNAMPCGIMLSVKLLLDVSCNILFNIELVQCLGEERGGNKVRLF